MEVLKDIIKEPFTCVFFLGTKLIKIKYYDYVLGGSDPVAQRGPAWALSRIKKVEKKTSIRKRGDRGGGVVDLNSRRRKIWESLKFELDKEQGEYLEFLGGGT